MLKDTLDSIITLSNKTDRVILFHSATGKDSIALLNLLHPHFKKVVCVFMYIVKDLEHEQKYIQWAKNNYPNIDFIQTPHYARYSYIKEGLYGCKANPKIAKYNLSRITDEIRKFTGIDWVVYGFKQSDGMNRRLMLRTYENEIINEKSKKIYPLSKWKNKNVLKYIAQNRLIEPIKYGKGQSQGSAIHDLDFLLYCREKHPNDLRKIINDFPDIERILFEYDYKEKTKIQAK